MTNLILSLVCFAWTANTEPDLAGYRLYHWTSGGTSNVLTLAANRTNACVSAYRGFTNYYALTAFNDLGNESYPTATLATTNHAAIVLHLERSDDLGTWTGTTWAVEVPMIEPQGFYRARVEFR